MYSHFCVHSWLCVSDWPVDFFVTQPLMVLHISLTSLVFVTRHSRTLFRSLSPFCALGHSRLWHLLVTRNHGFAKLSHSVSAAELGNQIWLFATTFCAFHNVITHMKYLQLNWKLFRFDVTLSLKLYTGGLSGALIVNKRTTAFGELMWAHI